MAVTALVLMLLLTREPARASLIFEGKAGADLVRYSTTVSPLLIEDVADFGALAAQAQVSSSGESTGYASTPYPGSQVTALPGFGAGAVGLPASPPDYPLEALSTFPRTPTSHVQAGSIDLAAASDRLTTTADARDGGSQAHTEVILDPRSDELRASASTELVKVDFGAGLTIGGVRSMAKATRKPGGSTETASSFSVASINILGQQLRYVDGKLQSGTAAAPVGGADDINGLLKTLADSGTTIRFLEPEEMDGGILSAGLEVRRQTQANGTAVTQVSTFGRAYAVTANREVDFSEGPAISIAPPDGTGSAAIPPNLPPFSSGQLPVPSPADSGTQGTADTPQLGSPFGGRSVVSITPETASGALFYPVLVLAGAVLVIASSVLRKWGERPIWEL